VIDKEIILTGYILEPPSKFRLVLCARKISDFGVCQQPIMCVICGSVSGENWREKRRKVPVPVCKGTLSAWFSLGIHASLSRPGLADLMVRGKISLHAAFTAVPNFSIPLAQPASVCYEEHEYTRTYQTAQRLYMIYRCYQITLQTKTESGEKFLLDIQSVTGGTDQTSGGCSLC